MKFYKDYEYPIANVQALFFNFHPLVRQYTYIIKFTAIFILYKVQVRLISRSSFPGGSAVSFFLVKF